MALAAGAQLAQVHRLARVEVEHVADPVAEAERVRRRLGQPGRLEPVELAPRELERALVLVADARLADLVGDAGAEVGAEPLPLAGQHPVALQVAEAAVVGDDLEPVADRLPAAARAVAAVAALAGELADQLRALDRVQGARSGCGSRPPRRRPTRTARREQVVLGAVDVDELDRGRVVAARGGRGRGGRRRARSPRAARAGARSSRRRGRAGRRGRRSSGSPAAARPSIISPKARASGSGEAASRSSSCS